MKSTMNPLQTGLAWGVPVGLLMAAISVISGTFDSGAIAGLMDALLAFLLGAELFFLDEVTALAAGHRPCFECRRADANDFASRFPADDTQPPGADMMDAILHRQRLPALQGVHQHAAIGSLPVGAMFAVGGKPYAVGQRGVLEWTFDGYLATDKRSDWQAGSHANLHPEMEADVLTPACIVTVLRNGYQPRWHKSAAP